MLIHVTISPKLLSFVVTLNLAIKDGLDVLFIWTLIEKKDCYYKKLVSGKAGKFFFYVLGKM